MVAEAGEGEDEDCGEGAELHEFINPSHLRGSGKAVHPTNQKRIMQAPAWVWARTACP